MVSSPKLMTAEAIYCFGPFRFDGRAGRLSRDGRVRPLRAKTSAVLLYLLEHRGRLVPKEELFAAIWPGLAVSEAVLAVCISELRQALEDERRDARLVETAHGKGYRFIAPVTIQSESILPASARGSEPPVMVGRESELARLRHNWELARARSPRFVLISGEAGVGKSALAARFLAYLQEFDAHPVGCGQCVERSGNAAVYVPILELLDQLCLYSDARYLETLAQRHAHSIAMAMTAAATVYADCGDALRLRIQFQRSPPRPIVPFVGPFLLRSRARPAGTG